ncbi:MAG TPA: hypothetical protein VFN91_04130 [Myxococcaceae bacterium]|nr:hypothetical protein [Myxococcaceae bacterium]
MGSSLLSRRALLVLGASALARARADDLPRPGVRNAHVLVHDRVRGGLVLFGGADAEQVRGDTWVRQRDRWRSAAVSGPPPRTFPAAAFDGRRRRLVLFGGNRVLFGPEGARDTLLDDTWEWDGEVWRRVPVSGPPARSESGACFDARRGRVVLFGGWRWGERGRERLGDTWEFDGTRWEQVSSSGPEVRSGLALAFDTRRGATVLVGGSAGRAPLADAWEWRGSRWEGPFAGPGARFNPSLAEDARRGELVCFGGWDGSRRLADTQVRRGDRWVVASSDGGPAPRNHTAMSFDAAEGRVLLFGGHDGERVFGDLWSWNGAGWKELEEAEPLRRVDNGH